MKNLSLILLSIVFVKTLSAQVTDPEAVLRKQQSDTTSGWKFGGVFSANLTQTSLSNWAAGGEESFSVTTMASVFANFSKGKDRWTNSIDIGYGKLRKGSSSNKFRKMDDKIDILSKYGREAFTGFYYSALVNLKTQMDVGYNYLNDSVSVPVSDFWAPAYLIGAVGLDYKPNEYFSAFAAPLTSKTIFVNSQRLADIGAFGVEAAVFDSVNGVYTKIKDGKRTKNEVGGYIRIIFTKANFKAEWLKNVSFTTKVDLFSNYLKNPDCIDVNWETQLLFKVNKFLAVNISTHLMYDDDVTYKNLDGLTKGPKIQFKEILGVGITYKF